MNDSSSAAAATATATATTKPNTQSSLTAATANTPEECDAEVWEIFNSSFSQVQAVLDRNRMLIRQVNENHQSKIPDNMVKNVALIQELNANISKVVSLYSDLSSNFSSAFHLRSGTSPAVEGGAGIPDPDPSAEGVVACYLIRLGQSDLHEVLIRKRDDAVDNTEEEQSSSRTSTMWFKHP